MSKVSAWLWGMILIAIGMVLGINALGIAEIDIFFPGWWTLIIIIPCFIDLFSKNSDKTGDLIGIMIGGCLMLACWDLLDFGVIWKLIVPVALVMIGLSMIFKDAIKGKAMKEVKKLQGKSGEKEYWATFSGQNLDFEDEKFEGCKLEAVFGGIKCDLRKAKIEKDVVVKASAVFGGVKIYAPKNVKVKMVSTAIFGGADNHHEDPKDDAKHTLYIDANAMFGGVEVK